MPGTDEPLRESAPLARELAREMCHIDPATGESCSWLHGFWQYIRLLGLGSTPAQNEEFFAAAIGTATAAVPAPRILVSGAADYSMLSVVLGACAGRDIRPRITVMDQCETPLALNRWYAARAGLEIVTPRCDIFEYADKSGFDLICTHSFLSEFPPARRPALLARWRALLRPGGMAITVNRLRPAGGSAPYGFTAEQAVAFRSAVLANARSGPGWPDPADLARDTELYIARRYAYAVRSREEVAALFENAGFRIAELSCDPVKTGVRQEVTGPTTPGGAQYARIRAIAS